MLDKCALVISRPKVRLYHEVKMKVWMGEAGARSISDQSNDYYDAFVSKSSKVVCVCGRGESNDALDLEK